MTRVVMAFVCIHCMWKGPHPSWSDDSDFNVDGEYVYVHTPICPKCFSPELRPTIVFPPEYQ